MVGSEALMVSLTIYSVFPYWCVISFLRLDCIYIISYESHHHHHPIQCKKSNYKCVLDYRE
jgi:hypothetical protein